MNETLALLMSRRSIRDYEDRPIPAEARAAILDAAIRAPTAGNMMLYSVIEVEDRALKERLAVSCDGQPFIARAPWVLVFVADWQRWMDYFEASGALGGGEGGLPAGEARTAGGPQAAGGPLAVRPREGDFLLALDDALIAAHTAAVAAESLGIGSCYIGDVMERYEEHRGLFGLPRYAFPAAMLCLGYPAPRQLELPRTERLPRDLVVSRDRYRRAGAADFEAMAAAGRRLPAFLPGAANYGQHVYLRKFSAAFSEEMRRSVRRALEEWD